VVTVGGGGSGCVTVVLRSELYIVQRLDKKMNSAIAYLIPGSSRH
jgi:hypothetical protein